MNESFTVYDRIVDGFPRVAVCADLSPKGRPDLTHVLLIPIKCETNPSGLPTGNELARAAKLEDNLVANPAFQRATHIGHICHKGFYTVVFRNDEPGPTSVEVKAGFFKKETLRVMTIHDPNWDWHEAEIAPTKTEFHRCRNHPIHESLRQNGDRSEMPRPVDFAAIFKTEAQRNAYLQSLKEANLNPTSTDLSTDDEGRFWAIVGLETAVTEDIAANLCAELEELAEKHEGEFDGWETILVR